MPGLMALPSVVSLSTFFIVPNLIKTSIDSDLAPDPRQLYFRVKHVYGTLIYQYTITTDNI